MDHVMVSDLFRLVVPNILTKSCSNKKNKNSDFVTCEQNNKDNQIHACFHPLYNPSLYNWAQNTKKYPNTQRDRKTAGLFPFFRRGHTRHCSVLWTQQHCPDWLRKQVRGPSTIHSLKPLRMPCRDCALTMAAVVGIRWVGLRASRDR